MAEDKEQYKKSIRFFNDREVRAVWDDTHNKWWFSVLDIIAAINEQDDYQKARNYWKYLLGFSHMSSHIRNQFPKYASFLVKAVT